MDRELCVRAVIVYNNRLLICRSQGTGDFFFLPGGRVEGDETLETALRREIKEELGCVCESISYLGVIDTSWSNSEGHFQALQHFFIVKISAGSMEALPAYNEADRIFFEWLDLEGCEITGLKPPSLLKFIRAASAPQTQAFQAYYAVDQE